MMRAALVLVCGLWTGSAQAACSWSGSASDFFRCMMGVSEEVDEQGASLVELNARVAAADMKTTPASLVASSISPDDGDVARPTGFETAGAGAGAGATGHRRVRSGGAGQRRASSDDHDAAGAFSLGPLRSNSQSDPTGGMAPKGSRRDGASPKERGESGEEGDLFTIEF